MEEITEEEKAQVEEISEEEKAQARREAGVYDPPDYSALHDQESNGESQEAPDPIALLKQRYQAGEIDDETLEQEIRKIAQKRVGQIAAYPKWERLLDAINVGLKAAIRDYQNRVSK